MPGFAASLGSILDRRSTQVTTFRAQYDAAIKPGERAKQARAQSAPFKQLKTATATRFSVLFEIVQNCVPTLTLLFDRICRLRIGGMHRNVIFPGDELDPFAPPAARVLVLAP
ncbi:MAG: hypothetical protein ABSA58_22420 [Acetobacteraceae bacterium]